MSGHPFPNCDRKCDGQWMATLGGGTLRPCRCRRFASAKPLALAIALLCVGALAWAWMRI